MTATSVERDVPAVLVPALVAFYELRISRERGMRLLLTRALAGERIRGKWYVHRDSIDAFARATAGA